KAALQKLSALRELSKKQQELLDQTFQTGQSQGATSAATRKLAMQQENLRNMLRPLLGDNADDETDDMEQGDEAMKDAAADLSKDAPRSAAKRQNEALQALNKAIKNMQSSLRASLFSMPRPGQGMAGADPFGRSNFNGFVKDDGGVKVP